MNNWQGWGNQSQVIGLQRGRPPMQQAQPIQSMQPMSQPALQPMGPQMSGPLPPMQMQAPAMSGQLPPMQTPAFQSGGLAGLAQGYQNSQRNSGYQQGPNRMRYGNY